MNLSLFFIVTILLLILVIILFGFIAARILKTKISYYSNAILGTSDVKKGIKNMQEEYANTPKSLSAMTSLCLPNIIKDFPDFNYEEMRERAKNLLYSYLLAVDAGNVSTLENGNSELLQKLEMHINMLANKSLREHFERIKVHRTEISQYRKDKGRCIITFQSSIQYYHYITNSEGLVVEGKRDLFFQSKYDIDLIYIQDRNLVENDLDSALGINCPNCGAPISGLGAKKCEYCASPIIELNIHAWSFSDLREIKNS